jgi:hypothetical protein
MGDSPGSPGFAVETSGLTGLASEVRTENEANLRPQASQVRGNLSQGVTFGAASASDYVRVAKDRYRQSLVRAMDVMEAYVQAAEVLATAAEKVAANYRQSDAMSAARSDEVTKALTEAIAAARAAQQRPFREKATGI